MRLEQPVGGVYRDLLPLLGTLSVVIFITSPVREVLTLKMWHFVVVNLGTMFVRTRLELE